jgi:hypothetical protein
MWRTTPRRGTCRRRSASAATARSRSCGGLAGGKGRLGGGGGSGNGGTGNAQPAAAAPLRCDTSLLAPSSTLLPRSYWLRFALFGSVEVPLYAWRRGRRGWALRTGAAIAGYWAAVATLWGRNPVATLYTLVLPYALSSLLLMFGNWCDAGAHSRAGSWASPAAGPGRGRAFPRPALTLLPPTSPHPPPPHTGASTCSSTPTRLVTTSR